MDSLTVQLAESSVLAALALGVAVVVLFGQIGSLRRRLKALERRADVAAATSPDAREPRPAEEFEPAYRWEAATPAAEWPASPAAAPVSGETRGSTFDWEIFAGGRLLNLIGGLVLVIGIGLALKYAFDKNWIDQTLRIGAGIVAGGGLVFLAEVLRARHVNRWFSQGLTGTGLGVLYVSAYAAFGSYHIWPFALAYGFMSCVTLAAFGLALRGDSFAVALLGWAGGFATPFVLNDGGTNEIGLASYVVLLDLGLVAFSLAKERWFALEPLAMAASYATALAWYDSRPGLSPSVSTIALLSIWGVFFAADLTRTLRFGERASALKVLLGVANLYVLCAYLAQVLLLQKTTFELVALALAAAYGLAYAASLKREAAAPWQRAQWYLSGVALAILATALRFDGMEIATVLAAEAVALAAVERAFRRSGAASRAPEASAGTAALVAAAACAFLAGPSPLAHAGSSWSFVFGSRDVALLALIAATYGVDRLRSGFRAWPQAAGIALRLAGLLGVFALAALHADGYRLAAAYALVGFAALLAGVRSMLADLETGGLVACGLGLCVALARPDTWHVERIFSFVPLANARFEAFAVLTLVLFASAELLRRRSLFPDGVFRVVRAIAALSAAGALTIDVRDFFERALAVARLEPPGLGASLHLAQLAGAGELAISGVWIAASLILIGLGVRLRIRDLRLLAIGLFDLTILKAFFVDLGGMDTVYRIAAFIGLGLVLLAVSYMYQRLERGFFSLAPRLNEEVIPA